MTRMVVCTALATRSPLVPVVFVLHLTLLQNAIAYTFPDYKDHECVRECTDGEKPRLCEYNFTIEWYHTMTVQCQNCPYNKTDCFRSNCVAAEGTPRAILTVNRRLPGPAIQVCEGDRIQVNVFSHPDMGEGVALHWHGLHQRGTQFSDGAEMITQCPITPFSPFQYEFVADNPGTHFWHSHAGLQRADGLFGALIVRQSPSREPHSDKYDHDSPDHVIIVNDWYVHPSINRYAAHAHGGMEIIKDKTLLINGQGIYRKFTDTELSSEVSYTPRAVFFVRQGESYRFRVIHNGVSSCPVIVSVSRHRLTMIASDGGSFQPVDTDAFTVSTGERYDFILWAEQSKGSYWLKVVSDCGYGERPGRLTQLAIIRYYEAPEVDPSDDPMNISAQQIFNTWNAQMTESRKSIVVVNSTETLESDFGRTPDRIFYLALDIRVLDGMTIRNPERHPVFAFERRGIFYAPQINKLTLMHPPSPLLFQHHEIPEDMFCNSDSVTANCTEEYCTCVHRLKVAVGDLVELIVVDEGVALNNNHPMHLHGHSFRVLALKQLNTSTTMETVKQLDKDGKIHRNLKNPVRKDTVLVPDGGYAVLRFIADNPGFWLFHCHIQFHAQTSMALVIQVGNKEDMPPKPKNFPTCGGWKFSGYDNSKTDPNACSDAVPSVVGSAYSLLSILGWIFLAWTL